MIRLSFKILQKYEMQHFENLHNQVNQVIDALPKLYQISLQVSDNCVCCNQKPISVSNIGSLCEKHRFAYDLLTNPFESNFLFLKEYFLTVRFIIESQKSINALGLMQYVSTLNPQSIFRKIIIGYSSNALVIPPKKPLTHK